MGEKKGSKWKIFSVFRFWTFLKMSIFDFGLDFFLESSKQKKGKERKIKYLKKQFKGLYNDSLLVCFVFTRGSTNIF
jgi:hypothetical protein